jgi:hypothetical protein
MEIEQEILVKPLKKEKFFNKNEFLFSKHFQKKILIYILICIILLIFFYQLFLIYLIHDLKHNLKLNNLNFREKQEIDFEYIKKNISLF